MIQQLNNWTFRACDEQQWRSAVVPGCVHTDLLRNGLIPDPFYGTNEHDLQWIDKKDWEYQSEFEAGPELLGLTRIDLVFEGLDTYADVYLNEQPILAADNMFRIWKVDVKEQLKPGLNQLRIRFRSPIHEDLPKLEKLGYALPAPNDQSELGGLENKRVSIFARKAPYHYGWDWGPRFVTSGIWREVRLEGWSQLQITDLYIRQDEVTAEAAKLTAVAEVNAEANWAGTLRITAGGKQWEQPVQITAGQSTVSADVELASPDLWWCQGLGEAHMYTFQAELLFEEEELAKKSVRTGLRDLKLIRERDEAGVSFYFQLNGVPVYVKGANHIPNDSFTAEVTRERYLHEIVTAVESNMNMLRVWGGGIYEEDVFYELCDEYGLLVWQDFMFACSMYPGDEAFLNSVRAEAVDNVKRLRNHPSLALWCGNNEIDSAWAHYVEDAGWGWKKDYSPEMREKLWADYEAIFHKLLPEVVSELSGNIAYWPSSPLRNLTGDQEQHAHKTTGDGDIHYWGVWHAIEPFENYNKNVGRFMSEYGFQSFPELKSVLEYAPEEALELESEIMLAHQKNGRGNLLIKEYMDMYLPEPKNFKSFLYMSQVLQAEAITMAIEAHRRSKPYCMGTLYWQMNDCWPVASWAGMDYQGRWKALQYAVKRSFAPVVVIVQSVGDDINFYAVSDLGTVIQAELVTELRKLSGELILQKVHSVALGAGESTEVFHITRNELLGGLDSHDVILTAVLKQGGDVIAAREHYLAPEKELKLVKPNIKLTEATDESGGTVYTLETDTLARQVWLSTPEEGIFSDNFFDLVPGQPRTVEFKLRSGEGSFVPAAASRLDIKSMADFVGEASLVQLSEIKASK
ncbi:glycoside hydrolase family 2 protein [Paenibacillus sp. YPG26]|uniref:beta-mannosidase n=1 Tax=Paenibacillus sp. YPG26 TaxID=2878915 RepID=UPI00204252ED|nr:glycoside hydrolase family 2 protein [Paenibacillus sp. YPG26]USB33646.1 glycoside hydrolase family 2 protein [Paenibacillus sp. YPG26]